METLFFYLFATGALLGGLLVVANPFSRSPVTSAMFLVVTMVALAGLFILLRAFFLAAVQILVYAGAVIVLFLFVIMLLDLRQEGRFRIAPFSLATSLIAAGAVGGLLIGAIGSYARPAPRGGAALEGLTEALGRLLFSSYVLPFEILSVLLLAAMIGVILLSKRDAA